MYLQCLKLERSLAHSQYKISLSKMNELMQCAVLQGLLRNILKDKCTHWIWQGKTEPCIGHADSEMLSGKQRKERAHS